MTPCHVNIQSRSASMTQCHVKLKTRPVKVQSRTASIQHRTASVQLRTVSIQTRTASHQPRRVNALNYSYLQITIIVRTKVLRYVLDSNPRLKSGVKDIMLLLGFSPEIEFLQTQSQRKIQPNL
jgi:hypothetical protein